jgi:hypothetical protein
VAIASRVAVALQGLRRQFRFADRLFRYRPAAFDSISADQREDGRDRDQDTGDDQERGPHRHLGRKTGRRAGEPETERVEREDRADEREDDADRELRDLLLQLRGRKLELEARDRACAVGDSLRALA